MYKLLKSQHNDFPQFYSEYALADLGVFMTKLPEKFLPIIEKDILERGMVHPIIIFSPYAEYQTDPNPELPEKLTARKQILRVYMGHKRIWVAQKHGYTHISAYHVKTDEDARFLCGKTTIREFCPN
jgi:hypothetical protein